MRKIIDWAVVSTDDFDRFWRQADVIFKGGFEPFGPVHVVLTKAGSILYTITFAKYAAMENADAVAPE